MSKRAKKSGISSILSFIIIAIMLSSLLSFSVSAANPIVFDFSKYNNVEDILSGSTGGNGEFAILKDGDKWVLFAECVDGYAAEDDPDGKNTKGDLYATILDFGSYEVDADVYQWMKIGVKNQSAAPCFEFHFDAPSKGYNVETSVNLDINPNSDYTAYVYNVTEQCKKYYPKRAADVGDPNVYPDHWHGVLNGFRLDFMYYEESGGHAKTGDKIYVEYIAFFDSEQAANDYVFTPARTAVQAEEAIQAAAAEQAEKAAASKAAAEAAAAERAAAAEAAAAEKAAAEAAEDEKNVEEIVNEDNTANKDDSSKITFIKITPTLIGGGIAVVVIIIIIIIIAVSVSKKKKK